MKDSQLHKATTKRTGRLPGALLPILCASLTWLALPSTSLCDAGDPLNTGQHPYNREITFSGYAGSETLTDFPVLLIFNSGIADFDYGQFKADGSDLRFADAGGLELAYEIELWNASGNSYIWVNVGELESNTNIIKMYWGNLGLSQPAYTTNGSTWSSDFAGVWHMTESSPNDATANGHDGTGSGNTNAPGHIYTAQDMDGNNDFIDVSTVASSLSGTDFAISGWVKTLDTGNLDGLDFGSTFAAISTSTKSEKAWVHVGPSDVGNGVLAFTEGATAVEINTGTAINNDAWRHIFYTRTGTSGDLYIDGVNKGSHSGSFALLSNDIWTIGCRWKRAGLGSSKGRFLDGMFDEIRVSDVARSTDWIKACWDSQKPGANFVTYGEVLSTPSVGTVIFGW